MCNYDNYADSCSSNRCDRVLWLVTAIIGALFLFTLGLILGAVFSGIIMSALAAIIILAIVLFILTIVLIIISRCRCRC